MSITTNELILWLGAYFWPFVRIGAMLMAAPVFGARFVNTQVRVFIAIGLTLIVAPIVPPMPLVDPFSYEMFATMLQQILLGVTMGFVLTVVFGIFTLAGQFVANAMGLGFASMADPANGVNVPVIGQLYSILVTLLFIAMNGHLWLISMVVDSFTWWPVGINLFSLESYRMMADWGVWLFAGGILVALPTITAVLLVNIAFGVVVRAAPTLNIFAVGFPVTLLMGILVIMFSLPTLMEHLEQFLGLAKQSLIKLQLSGS